MVERLIDDVPVWDSVVLYLVAHKLEAQASASVKTSIAVEAPRAIVVGLPKHLLAETACHGRRQVGLEIEGRTYNTINQRPNAREHPNLGRHFSSALQRRRREVESIGEGGHGIYPLGLIPFEAEAALHVVGEARVGRNLTARI